MRIGIDIMGGDFAPLETTRGAILARQEVPAGVEIMLIGDENAIKAIMKDEGADASQFLFHHTTEVIGMGEHPTKAIQQKPMSSLAQGFQLLKENVIQGFASAGNTGAMMVGSMFSVKTIPGILRPTISTLMPQEKGGVTVLLDVGVNADCKPEMLMQFGMLGTLFASAIYGIENPRVGLMNIGEEEEKGNILSQQANQLLKASSLNFIGNVEGRDLFNDTADVIVCDGFTGNVMLKEAESFYSLIRKRGIKDEYFERFNYENYGGTPILGVNSNVVIAHGISKAVAIKNMIKLTGEITEARLSEKISRAFANVDAGSVPPSKN